MGQYLMDAAVKISEHIRNAQGSERRRASYQRRFGADDDGGYQDDTERSYSRAISILEELDRLPERFQRYSDAIKQFYSLSPFERSVFIMTKFPDGKDIEGDQALKRVVRATENALEKNGMCARIARSGSQYLASLWENVELHLLGCSMGIAIVEDKSVAELNPNVAMEWGFMRAFGKPVLYLEEEEFSHQRVDWQGLIKRSFSWTNPEKTIEDAVTEWLATPHVKGS